MALGGSSFFLAVNGHARKVTKGCGWDKEVASFCASPADLRGSPDTVLQLNLPVNSIIAAGLHLTLTDCLGQKGQLTRGEVYGSKRCFARRTTRYVQRRKPIGEGVAKAGQGSHQSKTQK